MPAKLWTCTVGTDPGEEFLNVAYWDEGGIWGIRRGKQLDDWWVELDSGDVIVFYFPHPISGLVGAGKVEKRFKKETELVWPDEKEEQTVLYPHCFEFERLYPKSVVRDWQNVDSIDVSNLKIRTGSGLAPVTEGVERAKLIRRIRNRWDLDV